VRNFLRAFILCGITGWIIECIYTGLISMRKGNLKLTCQTSIWMLPIYGLAVFIPTIYKHIKKLNIVIRALIYALLIISVEYVTGSLLSLFDGCPWSYSESAFNYMGIIRLDYFPLWMLVGIIYEYLFRHVIINI
jgi:uncharacterized membrane protein